jgi:prefoldin subunit 5
MGFKCIHQQGEGNMKKSFERITGGLLMAAALFGLMIGLLGLAGLWWFEPRAEVQVESMVKFLSSTVDTTDSLISLTDTALGDVEDSMTTMQEAADAAVKALDNTAIITDDLADLTGEDFPRMVGEIQSALGTMSASAKLVDDTLTLFSNIPLIGSRYEPEVPLSTSVDNIDKSLERVPQMLERMQTNLGSASSSMEGIQDSVKALSGNVSDLNQQIGQTRELVTKYRELLKQLETRLETVQPHARSAVRGVAIILSLFDFWFLVAQLGLWTQGAELRKKEKQKPVVSNSNDNKNDATPLTEA